VSKADVSAACKIVRDRLGEAWKGGGCAAQFLALVKKFKKGEPGVGRLIGAHVAVAWKVGGTLYPGRVMEYAEEGGEGKERNENAGKHKVEFADGIVEWCMMDLREHVAFGGELGRPLGEAMAATDFGKIVAMMCEARDDEDARKAAMLGCVALGSLAASGNAKNRGAIAAAEGLAAVIGSINVEIQVAIAAAGGVAAVIGAMGRCEGDAGVQEYGCYALGMLARNAENQAAIAAAGGIAVVIGGMGRFEEDAGVQRWGCGALGNLAANNDENNVAIAAAGGIAAVIGCMGRFEGDAGVQRQGCLVLQNLAGKGKEGKKENK
jgi:hypothetical protein